MMMVVLLAATTTDRGASCCCGGGFQQSPNPALPPPMKSRGSSRCQNSPSRLLLLLPPPPPSSSWPSPRLHPTRSSWSKRCDYVSTYVCRCCCCCLPRAVPALRRRSRTHGWSCPLSSRLSRLQLINLVSSGGLLVASVALVFAPPADEERLTLSGRPAPPCRGPQQQRSLFGVTVWAP